MDKKKRLLILIFVLILSGIVVIFIHKNGSMKGDSIMEENAISGDDNTHWFHSNGIITSIDNSQKKICVDISQKNNFFDGTNITLNCNKSYLDITYLEAGPEITFYFFENNVLDTEVAIEKLNIVTP